MNHMLALAGFLILSYGAAAAGSAFTRPAIGTWYARLKKPSWTPPGSLIGAVWSVLYTLMGVTAFLTWRRGPSHPRVRGSLTWFGLQLALNTAWSAIFFGFRRPGLALADIALLWTALVAWLRSTLWVDRRAATLILPYLAWVSFAAGLNAAIWRLNRPT